MLNKTRLNSFGTLKESNLNNLQRSWGHTKAIDSTLQGLNLHSLVTPDYIRGYYYFNPFRVKDKEKNLTGERLFNKGFKK
jgi:hypothetical protein